MRTRTLVAALAALVPGRGDLLAPGERASAHIRFACVAGVFLVALAVRVAYFDTAEAALYGVEQERYRVAHYYHEAAASLAEGDDRVLFPDVATPIDTLAAGYPPGYFAFVAFIYRVLGHEMAFVLLVQCVLDSLCAAMLVLVGEALFSTRVGVFAGLLMAVSPQFAYLTLVVKPDTLAVFPVVAALLLSVRGIGDRRSRDFAVAGVMLGVACWLRQNALLLPIAIAFASALVATTPRPWRGPLLLVASCALVVAPITIRNVATYGSPVPVTFGSGFALLSGLARDDYDRRYGLVRYAYNFSIEEARARNLDDDYYFREYDALQRDHRRKYDVRHTVLSVFAVDGIARDRERTRRAIALIADDPVYFASIYVRRLGRLLGFSEQLRPVPPRTIVPTRSAETFSFYAALGASEEWNARNGTAEDHLRAVARRIQTPFRTGPLLALAAVGLVLVAMAGWRRTVVVLLVPVYYLGLQALMWAEFRHTLPAHLATFALCGVTVEAALRVARLAWERFRAVGA